MNILGHDFGLKKPPLIIAEIGSGHAGDLETAKGLIFDAARSGADAVKIQTYTADSMTIDCNGPDFEVKGGLWKGRNLYELYTSAATPRAWHRPLFDAAAEAGIHIFSSPFSSDDVDFLEELGCPAYKIASPEIGHMELLEAVRATKKPVFLSTGMASLHDIRRALDALYGRDVVILHCVSGYPTPVRETNLWSIRNLISHFPRHEVGFSDHTINNTAAVAAVACGATVFEKHIGERDSEDGTFACRPDRFRDYVSQIEMAWSAMQVENPRSEEPSMQMRRSVYVVENIKAGDVFTGNNIKVIRPGYGLDPGEYENIIGKKSTRDIEKGTALYPGMFE